MAHRMEELIGIPFPNHSSDVLCCLNEQRRDGLLCDVVLIVRDQEYRTHRSILAACSQYFKKLFTVSNDGGGGHHTAVYEIDFVAPESLTAILEFAYTSTLTVTTSNVKEILSAARMFEIPCIVNVCLEIMDSGGERDGRREEDEDEDEEDLEADEDDEEDEDEGDDVEEARKDMQEDHGDATSERSTRSSESRVGSSPTKQVDSPPCTSQYQTLKERTSKNTDSICRKPSQRDSMESRTLKDFSIESLLQEGLYPRIPVLDRSSSFSPLLPGFYSPMWASEFPGISQHIMEAGHSLHPSHPPYPAQPEACPLNLAVKREVIKEELKDDVQSNLLHGNFLKDFVSSGLAMVGTGGADGHLAQVKDETDFRSYMGFLSASHLGALFPPWQLEEERKMKPKASQQCPICNKIIQGAGKLPRHMRTHTGEKPYMCTICEVRFTRQDKLKIHMRKHTGERPYICLHCNSKFVHNYDLKNHLRIHTGVRPYQCEHCYKSFTRSDHLHRHIKRQSCRVSRPRRGRKPAAWRQAKSFLCPPAPPSSYHTEENGLPGRCRVVTSASSSSPGVKGHKGKEMHGLGSRGVAYKDFDSESRGTREGKRVERKHVMEEGGRPRGVFTFGLAGGEEVLHPQFYSTAADPWTMRLDRAPPIPEPAN